MGSVTRRTVILGLPALSVGLSALPAQAAIQGLLIRASSQAVSNFFARTGARRAASAAARQSAARGLQRMEASGFQRYKDEFVGGIAAGAGTVIGEDITTQVVSAVRPNKTNGIVYCAAIGTDCNGSAACRSLQRAYPASGDSAVTGGFQEIDKQVVLLEEANAIGLDWVASKRNAQGWSNGEIAGAYYPVGFIKRDIGRTGRIREQQVQFLTPKGRVTTEERIDYSDGSGHVSLTAYADGQRFDDYFTFAP